MFGGMPISCVAFSFQFVKYTPPSPPAPAGLPVYREGLGRRGAYCRAIAIRTASSGETR